MMHLPSANALLAGFATTFGVPYIGFGDRKHNAALILDDMTRLRNDHADARNVRASSSSRGVVGNIHDEMLVLHLYYPLNIRRRPLSEAATELPEDAASRLLPIYRHAFCDDDLPLAAVEAVVATVNELVRDGHCRDYDEVVGSLFALMAEEVRVGTAYV